MRARDMDGGAESIVGLTREEGRCVGVSFL